MHKKEEGLMYLSRLILDPRSRAVRRDLADCQALHRTVLSAFPDLATAGGQNAAARAALGVLHRVEAHPRTGQVVLLVQSRPEPDWSRLVTGYLLANCGDAPNPACKPVAEQYGSLGQGRELVFRLRANPTRKVDTRSGPEGQRRNGRRVELRTEEQQMEWLRRKGADHGFRIIAVRVSADVPDVRATAEPKQVGYRASIDAGSEEAGRRRLTFGAVVFDGRLRVEDAVRFRETLEQGIGSGKAYGFGLLSIAPTTGGDSG